MLVEELLPLTRGSSCNVKVWRLENFDIAAWRIVWNHRKAYSEKSNRRFQIDNN